MNQSLSNRGAVGHRNQVRFLRLGLCGVWGSLICAATASLSTPASADTLAGGIVSEQLVMDDEFITGVSQPTAIAVLPDGRFLVTERAGELVLRTTDGTLTTAATFDVNSGPGEQGLLNVLPHPDFENNHLLYFYYSRGADAGGTSADRHRVSLIELGDDNMLDMSTEQVIVSGLIGPANHNGGGLAVYGDYLFVGAGDTGANSNSPPGEGLSNYYGTCLTNAQGKVLRVHLDGSIPTDNPLVGQTVTACGDSPGTEPSTTSDSPREDIFAWGFRNPWRLWADPQTGNVWVGNVGEITFEMIQVIPPAGGVHFGWPYREGNQGLGVDSCQTTIPNTGDCVDAVYVCEANNSPVEDPDVADDCDSITGGTILSDCWPEGFEGQYVFGDYTSSNVWTLPLNDARNAATGERQPFLSTSGGPVDIREVDGALYVVAHSGNGHITRITPQTPDASCVSVVTDPGSGGSGGMGGAGGGPGDGASGGPGMSMIPDAGAPDASVPGMGGSGGMPSMPEPEPPPMPEPEPPPTVTDDVPDDFDPGDPPESDPDEEETGDDVPDETDSEEDPGAAPEPGEPSADSDDESGPATPADGGGGSVAESASSEDGDDCDCRMVGRPARSNSAAWLGLLLGAVLLRRRR